MRNFQRLSLTSSRYVIYEYVIVLGMVKGIFMITTLAAAGVFYWYTAVLSPCDKPLAYSIGQFDTQFGVSEETFKAKIKEAETVWETALGRDIFSYDPSAKFKINLVFDERQKVTVAKQKTEFGLSAVEETFKNLDSSFNIFKAKYEVRAAAYEGAKAAFNSRQSEYESKVNYWNGHGGAPAKEYTELQKESQSLQAEANSLNQEAAALNMMSRELNALLQQRNTAAEKYNKVAENYNQKYGHGLEFDQAEYVSEGGFWPIGKINVYQFGDTRDLTLALAHEFGHALSMDHVENPASIMYYLTESDTLGPLSPSAEDLAELKRVCRIAAP